MLLLIFQILAFVTGLVAYYFALFMYEDEQGRLLNRVEQMWMAINDRKKAAGGLAPALVNRVAAFVKRAFDRIFGSRLFSLQLIGVSVCYSLATLFLGVALLAAWIRARLQHLDRIPSNIPADIISTLGLGVKIAGLAGTIFLVLGVLPAIKRSALTIFFSLLPAIIMISGAASLAFRSELTSKESLLIGSLALAFLSDVALLAVVRVSVSRLARENKTIQILIAIVAQIVVIGLLVVLPYESFNIFLNKYGKTDIAQGVMGLVIFNLPTGVAASLFLLTLFFVLLHRTFWPLLDRIVYPVAARRVLGNTPVMTGFGTACMAFALPWIWRLLKAVTALFGKNVM